MTEAEDLQFKVHASKTITATFIVYADDEEDARDQVQNAVGGMYEVNVPDADHVEEDDWDVADVSNA